MIAYYICLKLKGSIQAFPTYESSPISKLMKSFPTLVLILKKYTEYICNASGWSSLYTAVFHSPKPHIISLFNDILFYQQTLITFNMYDWPTHNHILVTMMSINSQILTYGQAELNFYGIISVKHTVITVTGNYKLRPVRSISADKIIHVKRQPLHFNII